MEGNFDSDNWYVITRLPMQEVFAPIQFFRSIFLATIVLTFMIIVMVSNRQIMHLLKPLKRLSEGTEKISNRQFYQEISIDSNDELEDLADSFNQMSSRLSHHFNLLTNLSEVDRHILSGKSTDEISNIAWSSMQDVFNADFICLASLDSKQSLELSVHSGETNQRHPHHETLLLPAKGDEFKNQLLIKTEFLRSELQAIDSMITGHLQRYEFTSIQVVPLLVDQCWLGFVALGFCRAGDISADNRQLLKDFADRMAVSITTSLKEKELYQQAHYDYLTRLPNRKLLRDRLEELMIEADENHLNIAIVYLDLDNFKQINDSLGHTLGDQLLIDVSGRLTDWLNGQGVVARQGGDEFILLLPNLSDERTLHDRLSEILHLYKEPAFLGGHYINASLSLGVAIYPKDGNDVDKLLMNADTALYHAKSGGRACYSRYQESMNTAALMRLELENSLWHSIEKQQVMFHYQPLFNVRNSTFGFEALMRWHHPIKGIQSPDKFIAVAEETGFMLPINEWMFANIFEQINRWRFDDGISIDKVAINISPVQLLSNDFVSNLAKTIEQFSIPVKLIELEITEGVFIENQKTATERLYQLKSMGLSLALDDFGTGYSSLSYLQ